MDSYSYDLLLRSMFEIERSRSGIVTDPSLMPCAITGIILAVDVVVMGFPPGLDPF